MWSVWAFGPDDVVEVSPGQIMNSRSQYTTVSQGERPTGSHVSSEVVVHSSGGVGVLMALKSPG